jgi:IS5 family transposase
MERKANERKGQEPTFLDGMTGDLGDPRMMAQLDRLNQAVPWERLAEPIRATYRNGTARGGRPNVPVVMMLKIVLLQKWFNVSDPGMESLLRDRISFRRFVGLGWEDPTPDETTIVEFRKRLREHGLVSQLFDRATAHLKEQGLIVQEGTLVDATIIEAPRGRSKEDGLSNTKEPAASYTKKHGRTYHGYKAHIATDVNGMGTDYVFDTAKVHDSQHIDQLIEHETSGGAVYADSAYMDRQRKERLEGDGVFCGIIERRVRGQTKLTDEQKEHNRKCAAVRAMVETPFAHMKNTGGYLRTRFRGLTRNAMDFALGLMACNFRRSLSLQA